MSRSMTPEGRMKMRVRKRLAECSAPVYLFMPVQNGMGEATLDFIGCIGGKFFGVETKAGYGGMTPRQLHTAMRMREAGAAVFLLNENPEGWHDFDFWLASMAAIAALEHPEGSTSQVSAWLEAYGKLADYGWATAYDKQVRKGKDGSSR
jgi:hypothetical protein